MIILSSFQVPDLVLWYWYINAQTKLPFFCLILFITKTKWSFNDRTHSQAISTSIKAGSQPAMSSQCEKNMASVQHYVHVLVLFHFTSRAEDLPLQDLVKVSSYVYKFNKEKEKNSSPPLSIGSFFIYYLRHTKNKLWKQKEKSPSDVYLAML